jgi:hypothetical protein
LSSQEGSSAARIHRKTALFRAPSSYIGYTVRCDSVRLRVVEDRSGKGNYWVMGESERGSVGEQIMLRKWRKQLLLVVSS